MFLRKMHAQQLVRKKNDEQILQNPVQAILVVFTVKRFACRLVSYRNTKYVLIRLNFKCNLPFFF